MIDTHCHVLDLAPAAVESLRRSGTLVVGATRTSEEFARLQVSFPAARWLRPAIGLHPELVGRLPAGEIHRFEQALAGTSYVVEVGMDGSSRDPGLLKMQRSTFERVLEMCAGRKFVSVHARRAEVEALDVVNSYGRPVVFHWFTGGPRILDQVLSARHLVAVNSAMVRSTRVRELVASIPREQVVTESDAPFASRSQHPAADLESVYAFLGATWGESFAAVSRQIAQNVLRLIPSDERQG
jgi:TatD DNase family protein